MKVFKDSKEVNKEIEHMKKNYEEWLKHSSLTEEQLLMENRNVRDFEVVMNGSGSSLSISLQGELEKKAIGAPLIPSKCTTLNDFIVDAIILLFHVAAKLDSANENGQGNCKNAVQKFAGEALMNCDI